MARKDLTVVTYNIHKGLSQFNRRLVLHDIREGLKKLDCDVAFLQEVQGKHDKNARRHVTWPGVSQHEFLTHDGCHAVYGMNAVYQHGHHGNAVVSRHPIPAWENIDISHHPIESRLHKERLVGKQINLHAGRRGGLQLRQLGFDRFDDIQRGTVSVFQDLNEHRAFAIRPHNIRLNFKTIVHVGHITHIGNHAIVHLDGNII